MKKLYIRNVLVGLSFVAVLTSAITSASGPGGGLSNAPGDPGGNCSSCHGTGIITTGNANLNSLRLFNSFTGNGYIPDSTYDLAVTFKQTGKSKFGFQVTVLDATNSPIGTLSVPTGATRVNKTTAFAQSKTREYIEHTNTGTANVGTDSTRWEFKWKAPNKNVGKVKFYVVVNATDNSGTANTGDLIYGKVFEVGPSSLLPTAIATSNDSVTCANYIAQMNGSGTNSPTTYTWTFPTGNPPTSSSQNPTVSFASPGTKFVTLSVKNSKGVSSLDTLKIDVKATPGASTTPATASTICPGDSLKVLGNTGAGLTYLWTPGNLTTKDIFVKAAGIYKLKTTLTSTQCTATRDFTLSHHTLPTVSIAKVQTNDTFCDSYNETITASGTLIDSVYWYVNGVLTRRTKTSSTVFTGTNKINVTAVAKSINGCRSTISNTVALVVRPKLNPANITSSKTTSTIRLDWDKTPGINGITYSLNNINFNPVTTDTSLVLTGLTPNTTYDITLRSSQASPCLTSDITISIKTSACSNLSYVIDLAPRACKGSTMTATVKNLFMSKYSISFNNNPYSQDTVFNFPATQSDTLTINIIDSLSPTCPPIIDKVGYTVDTLFDKDTGSLIRFTVTQCTNSYLYTLKTGYSTYEFYKNNTLVSTGASSFLFTNLVTGDKLTAKGKINSCEKVYGPVSMVVNSKPNAVFTYQRAWKNYIFTAQDGSNSEYKWYAGSTLLGSANNLNSDFTAYDNSNVTVKLVTKNSGGCSDSSSQAITVPKFSSVDGLQNSVFKLYPNPFGDKINIESLSGTYQVQVVNNIGQVIFSMEMDGAEQSILTSEWARGIYYIVIKDQDNRISRFTFVKQ
jgi:hypothetical protein